MTEAMARGDISRRIDGASEVMAVAREGAVDLEDREDHQEAERI